MMALKFDQRGFLPYLTYTRRVFKTPAFPPEENSELAPSYAFEACIHSYHSIKSPLREIFFLFFFFKCGYTIRLTRSRGKIPSSSIAGFSSSRPMDAGPIFAPVASSVPPPHNSVS